MVLRSTGLLTLFRTTKATPVMASSGLVSAPISAITILNNSHSYSDHEISTASEVAKFSASKLASTYNEIEGRCGQDL